MLMRQSNFSKSYLLVQLRPAKQSVLILNVAIQVLFLLVASPKLAKTVSDQEKEEQKQVIAPIPPPRTRSPETIRLPNGSVAFVSTLDEYLSGTTELFGPATEGNNIDQVTSAARAMILNETSKLANSSERLISENRSGESNEHLYQHQQHNEHNVASGGNASSMQIPKPIPQHWQVKSLLNVTHDYPLAYSQIICGYVWPLMAALTLFTNLMIVFVLTQHDMRTPTNVVLTAIAIADIIPIVVPVPWFVYLFAMGNEKQVLYPPIACYFYQHSTRSVSEIFYFLSTWLNVLLAVQDYLTACWPKLARKYCQIKVVVIEILALTVFAFLLNLPQALKLVFKPVKFYYNGQLTWGCRALQARWFKDLVGEYVALYDDIFTSIIVLFVDGGPALLLITLTALLIRQLHRQRIQGHLLMEQARTASKRRRERHRQQEYEASARVMIFVLLAFLAVKIPFATTYTLMIIQSRFDIHFVENLVDFQKAITLTDLVFVLSYPLNFTIFCCCSKKFRHKCAQLLGECNENQNSAKNRLMRSLSGSFNSDSMSQVFKRDSIATLASNANYQNNLLGAAKEDSKQQQQQQTVSSPMDEHQEELLANHQRTSGEASYGENGEHFNYASGLTRTTSQTSSPLQSISASRQPPQQVLDVDGFRALMDDGSLCLECIMRYENLRRSSNQSGAQLNYDTGNSSPACSLAGAGRRPSEDSSQGWPASGPGSLLLPPPPPSSQFYHHLPHIVTTRCESIREQSQSSEEAKSGSQRIISVSQLSVGQMGNNQKKQVGRRDQERQQLLDSSSNVGAASSLGGGGANDSRRMSRASQFSSVSTHKNPNYHNNNNNNEQPRSPATISVIGSQSDYGHWTEPIQARLSPRASLIEALNVRLKRSGTIRGGSDPGTMRGSATGSGSRRLPAEIVISSMGPNESRRSSDYPPPKVDGDRQKPPTREEKRTSFGKLGDKHRSLSMSNSKLSTLPNATGMLADILATTMMASFGSQRSNNQTGEGNSRMALSEPPIHFEQRQQSRKQRRESRDSSFR